MKLEGVGRRRTMMLLLRVTVSAGLIAFLLLRVDLGAIAEALGETNMVLFGFACLLFLAGQWINTERWRQLLVMALGSAPAHRFLLGLVFAGMFFNFFLPSTVGGDVARAELVRNRLGSRKDAYLSIVTARLLALIAVLGIGLAASLVAWKRFGWFDRDLALSALAFLLLAVSIPILAQARVGDRLARAKWLPVSQLEKVRLVLVSFRAYTSDRARLTWILALSVAAQFAGNVFVVWALAAALAIEAPVSFHFVAVPLITLITLLPISINGIGVREGGFIFYYAKVGVAGDEAVAMSLAYTLVLVLFSVVGGLCLTLGRNVGWPREPGDGARAIGRA